MEEHDRHIDRVVTARKTRKAANLSKMSRHECFVKMIRPHRCILQASGFGRLGRSRGDRLGPLSNRICSLAQDPINCARSLFVEASG